MFSACFQVQKYILGLEKDFSNNFFISSKFHAHKQFQKSNINQWLVHIRYIYN